MASTSSSPLDTTQKCAVCDATTNAQGGHLSQCSRCKQRYFCGPECQTRDWPSHKTVCKKPWYDKHRKCQDGSRHEGTLELITWSCTNEDNDLGEPTGWGNVLIAEADDLKRKFEVEMNGDLERFYDYWPQGFRWTCCGTDAGMDYGCDHHGTGSKPCTCDFCRMGKSLPDSIYNRRSPPRMGLQLPRGPDPRSFHAGLGAVANAARGIMGMEQ